MGATAASRADVGASTFAWAACRRVWDGMCAQTPPQTTPIRRTPTEIVFSLLRNMVFNTPRVREITEVETEFAAASRVTAASADSIDEIGTN